jgi:hypothetical protein
MTLFLPRPFIQRLWPWTKNVERILRLAQPHPFAGSHLMMGSDYSGDHKASRFRVYCYLLADTDASPDWPLQRQLVRQRYLPDGRRMAFKSLGDKHRQRALVPFLEAAETIRGHIVALIVTKELTNICRGAQTTQMPCRRNLGSPENGVSHHLKLCSELHYVCGIFEPLVASTCQCYMDHRRV